MGCRKIIEQYLVENGYDGLCGGGCDCGCSIGDLMPCGSLGDDCKAAYAYEVKSGKACKACDNQVACPLYERFIDYDVVLHKDDMPLKCRIKKEGAK